MPAWPSTVPDLCRLDDLRIAPVNNSMMPIDDSGPPMTRRRFTGDMEDIQGIILAVSRTTAVALRNFWRDDLSDGSLTFTAQHPMTGETGIQFIFTGEPQISRVGHLYNIGVSFRRIA